MFSLVRQAVRQTSDHVHHLPAEQVGPTGVQPVRKVHDQVEAQRNIKKGENKFCDDSTAIYSLPERVKGAHTFNLKSRLPR